MPVYPAIRGLVVVATVYRIYHKESGRSYVGSTFDIRSRANSHFLESTWNNPRFEGYPLYIDMKKLGPDAFAMEVLETFLSSDKKADRSKLLELEVKWTNHFKAHTEGYNFKIGMAFPEYAPGTTHAATRWAMHVPGHRLSESHRRRLKEMMSGPDNPNLGRKQSIEWIRNNTKAVAEAKGGLVYDTPLAPEEVAPPVKHGTPKVPKGRDLSNPKSRDTAGEKNAFYGKRHSPESIEKQRQAKLNLPPEVKEAMRKAHSERMKGMNAGSANVRARAVRCVETGFVYGSITEAGVAIGAGKKNNISKALKEGCTCGGYHWEYADSPKTLG